MIDFLWDFLFYIWRTSETNEVLCLVVMKPCFPLLVWSNYSSSNREKNVETKNIDAFL